MAEEKQSAFVLNLDEPQTLNQHEARVRMSMIKEYALNIVRSSGATTKNAVVAEVQEMLLTLKCTPSASSSTGSNLLKWTGSYLADKYPLIPTALAFYIGAVIWTEDYFTTTECNTIYQIVEWAFLAVAIGYLAIIGFLTSTKTNFCFFMKTFWMDFLVFVFLVMALMTLPPLSCYTDDTVVVTILGVGGLLGIAVWEKIQEKVDSANTVWKSKKFKIDGNDYDAWKFNIEQHKHRVSQYDKVMVIREGGCCVSGDIVDVELVDNLNKTRWSVAENKTNIMRVENVSREEIAPSCNDREQYQLLTINVDDQSGSGDAENEWKLMGSAKYSIQFVFAKKTVEGNGSGTGSVDNDDDRAPLLAFNGQE